MCIRSFRLVIPGPYWKQKPRRIISHPSNLIPDGVWVNFFLSLLRRPQTEEVLKSAETKGAALAPLFRSEMIILSYHAWKTWCEPNDFYQCPICRRLAGSGSISPPLRIFLLTRRAPRTVSKSNIKQLLICRALITLIRPSFHWPPTAAMSSQGAVLSIGMGRYLEANAIFFFCNSKQI